MIINWGNKDRTSKPGYFSYKKNTVAALDKIKKKIENLVQTTQSFNCCLSCEIESEKCLDSSSQEGPALKTLISTYYCWQI